MDDEELQLIFGEILPEIPDMASSSSEVPFPMDNDWEYLHGGINPGIEENYPLVESIPAKDPEKEVLREKNNLPSSDENGEFSNSFASTNAPLGTSSLSTIF